MQKAAVGQSKLFEIMWMILRKLRFRQRIAVDMTGRSTASKMIGEDVSIPVALAPVGFTGMQHADGEIHAARAAEKFGVPFTLSTMSICSIEDVAENTSKAILDAIVHDERHRLHFKTYSTC